MDPDRGDVRGPIIVPRMDRSGMDRSRPKPNNRRRGQTGERPSSRHHHSRPSRNDYTSNYGAQGPMRILTKQQSDRMNVPGSVSIMQRDASTSSGDPTSPHTHQSPDPLPNNSAHVLNHRTNPHPSSHQLVDNSTSSKKIMRRHEGGGVSSSPSTFTPLHPSSSRGNSRSERDGMFSRTDSGFVGNVSGETFSTKLISKSLQWEDKVTEHLMEQSDFLVVGCLGKQGSGKSTIMSLLGGTRTGSGRPYLFRTQPKETMESNGYQTSGVDIAVTSERIILLDTQPVLSEAMLDQLISDSMVPSTMSPESYLDVLSLQMAIFMFAVCHVVVVVMETPDVEVMLRFLWIAEKLKPQACKQGYEASTLDHGDSPSTDYYPQIVFVLNHATPDDFQPYALKDLHGYIAETFMSSRLLIAGGMSLACSGLVPVGQLVPEDQKGVPGSSSVKTKGGVAGRGEVDEANVNLHLLPTNTNPQDTFGAHCVERSDKEDVGLNPVLSLIPMYFKGHPSFQILAEALRNQVFSVPRPSLRPTRNSSSNQPHPQQQQPMFEREWHDFARRMWSIIRNSDISQEHKRLLRDLK